MKPSRAAAADGELPLQRALLISPDCLAATPVTEPIARQSRRPVRAVHAGPVTGLVAQMLLIAAIAGAVAVSGVGLNLTGWVVGIACGVITNLALAHALAHYRADRMSPADWVTLARATLAVGVATLVAASFGEHVQVAVLVSLATIALILDALDGWVARRTQTEGALGARFDGEVDAFLILVLSVYVARTAGAWVLAIGAARYVFFAAGLPLCWMRAPLPPRYWRKVVCATEGVVLVVAATGVLPPALTTVVLLVALALLAESFGRDVWWLWSNRSARPERTRVRSTIAAVVTVFALLVVWAALVAPDNPQNLTPTAFLRLPFEGLVLVGLAVALPAGARRIVAGVAGPVLGLVVILKVLDLAFFSAFARPFDLVGDAGNAGIGIETLRAALGHTEANLIVYGGVALAIGAVVVTTLALFRLMRVAAGNRRRSLTAVAGLGAIWLVCSVSGAQLRAQTPVASMSAAGYVVHEVRAAQADIHDEGVFANQIRHDRFRNVPGSRLLTGLRGKDVLLVFVESYGRVSVQGSSFSPAIDSLLTTGTGRLKAAGFSARSAFVTSPGFGGISWLAHSTLQAGVWAGNQRRYDQLVDTNRMTLADAFDRAGWRSINFAPADDRSWPEGSSFYHYDKLYDRRDMGYRGPSFNYAPMPDQYMFAALQRLELAKPHRRPLFAEVDTVSSHMPWDRIPRMIPWNDLGNGSVFSHTPMDRQPSSFWWHPNQVKAAYARSLEYSLNALISFVQRYGRKNLVLVVVGDEQPLAVVSGQGASHDVPISLIAHDPSVLKRIGGWDWQSGLLPSPHAAVWPMSSFRDRFLTAFGPHRPPGRSK
jgi:phosphatidylglycerophosphate synthase